MSVSRLFSLPKELPLTKVTAALAAFGILLASGVANGLLAPSWAGATHSGCSDGIDNDDDKKYDYPEDPDCSSLDDEHEGPESQALFVSVTDGKESIAPNNTVIYVIRLRQQRVDQRDVDVDFHLPSQSNLVGADEGGRWVDGRVHWDNVTVQKGFSTTLTVQVHITSKALKEKLLVARVIAEGVTATDVTYIKGSAFGQNQHNFHISVTDGREFALPEEWLTYTITVTNRRTDADEADVRVTLPTFTFVEETPAGAESDSDSIVWRDQTFAGKERRTYSFRARIQKRTHDNVALFARAVAANASATDRTTVRRGPPPNDISVAITDNRTTVERGQILTYGIYLRNNSDHAEVDPWIAASVSTFAEFVSATEGGTWDGSNVRWEGQEIPSNGSRTLSYAIRVRPDAPTGSQILGGVIINHGMEHSDRTQVVDVSREDEEPLRVLRSPEVPIRPLLTEIPQATTTTRGLRIRQLADRSEAVPGSRIRYTLSVTNASKDTLAGAVVTVRYDAAAMRYIRSDGGRLVVDGNIRWELPRIEPGQTWTSTYTLSVRDEAPHGLMTSNTASVDGSDDQDASTARIGVIRDLPTTGVPINILAMSVVSLSGLASGGALYGFLRKWMLL